MTLEDIRDDAIVDRSINQSDIGVHHQLLIRRDAAQKFGPKLSEPNASTESPIKVARAVWPVRQPFSTDARSGSTSTNSPKTSPSALAGLTNGATWISEYRDLVRAALPPSVTTKGIAIGASTTDLPGESAEFCGIDGYLVAAIAVNVRLRLIAGTKGCSLRPIVVSFS
jgi:hypothetical protein